MALESFAFRSPHFFTLRKRRRDVCLFPTDLVNSGPSTGSAEFCFSVSRSPHPAGDLVLSLLCRPEGPGDVGSGPVHLRLRGGAWPALALPAVWLRQGHPLVGARARTSPRVAELGLVLAVSAASSACFLEPWEGHSPGLGAPAVGWCQRPCLGSTSNTFHSVH